MEYGDGPEVTTTHAIKMSELDQLSNSLSDWKEFLTITENFLLWKGKYNCYCIPGAVTTTFLLWWWLNASTITTIAALLLFIVTTDYFIPALGSKLRAFKEWDGDRERQFEAICQRLLNFRDKMVVAWQFIKAKKSTNSKLYISCICATLLAVGLLGYMVDNTLLCYLFALLASMYPGAYSNGYVMKAYVWAWGLVEKNFHSKIKSKDQ